MSVSTIEIGGALLEYVIQGPETGELIITLHGGRGFGSKESDFNIYKNLALNSNEGKYRVLSFDYRGHGNSSLTPPYTFKRIVDDIEELRLKFTQEKCIIIGGSFGGFLAQQYAITYPNSLRALILRGTAPSYHHEDDAFKVLEKNIKTKATNASIEMLKKVFSSFQNDEEFKLVMFALGPLYKEDYDPDQGLKNVLNTKYCSESHNSLYSEKEKYFDYREDLKHLEIPTLILVGLNDWICPPKQSRLMNELIKDSKLIEFENANHGVHIDKKEQVLKAISDFLA